MNELNHPGAGKGDKDRSPGWRANYDEVDFHRDQSDGFTRRGNRLVKCYTPSRRAVFIFPDKPEPSLVTLPQV